MLGSGSPLTPPCIPGGCAPPEPCCTSSCYCRGWMWLLQQSPTTGTGCHLLRWLSPCAAWLQVPSLLGCSVQVFPVKQRDAEAPAQPLIPLSAALHYFVPKSLFLPGLLISLFTSFPCAGDKEESSLLLLFSAVKGMENASLWPFHSRRGEGGR